MDRPERRKEFVQRSGEAGRRADRGRPQVKAWNVFAPQQLAAADGAVRGGSSARNLQAFDALEDEPVAEAGGQALQPDSAAGVAPDHVARVGTVRGQGVLDDVGDA